MDPNIEVYVITADPSKLSLLTNYMIENASSLVLSEVFEAQQMKT